MKRFISACLLAVTFTAPAPIFAGSSANGVTILPADQVASFSNRVQQDLAARGARVAIISRVGRDPAQLPDTINYTNIGIWVYSQITRADGSTGQGYQVYNLYQQADKTLCAAIWSKTARLISLRAHMCSTLG